MDAASTELIKSGVIGAFLVFVIYGGIARKYVFGWVYDEMEKDRTYWRDQAQKATDTALRGADVARAAAALADRTADDLAERTAAILARKGS